MTASPTYTATFNRNQLRVIMQALDAYQRLQMGQIDELATVLPVKHGADWSRVHGAIEAFGRAVAPSLISEVGTGGRFLGVGREGLPADNAVAYDIRRVIEHHLAWERAVEQGLVESVDSPRDFSAMMTVDYDRPAHYGSEPLPTIARNQSLPNKP
jgi:hypothetical protein